MIIALIYTLETMIAFLTLLSSLYVPPSTQAHLHSEKRCILCHILRRNTHALPWSPFLGSLPLRCYSQPSAHSFSSTQVLHFVLVNCLLYLRYSATPPPLLRPPCDRLLALSFAPLPHQKPLYTIPSPPFLFCTLLNLSLVPLSTPPLARLLIASY